MSDHTPGPWFAHVGEDGYFDVSTKEKLICTGQSGTDNALLVAAAPELLEASERALSKLLADWDRAHGHPLHVAYENEPAEASRLREAIDKAKGYRNV